MQKFLFGLVLLLVCCGVFSPLRFNRLVWEDAALVSAETPGANAQPKRFVDIWKPTTSSIYSPVSQMVQTVLIKVSPTTAEGKPDSGYLAKYAHSVAAIAHLTGTLALFAVLATCLQSAVAAFFGAMFFSVHPLQVEPVAYAAALPIVLAGSFGLLAIWRYVAYANAREKHSRHKSNPLLDYYIATGLFVLAILSSPIAVVVPLFALLFDQLLPRRSSILTARIPVWPVLIWLVIALPVGVLSVAAQNTDAIAESTAFWKRPFVAGDAISFYLSKTLAPIAIGPDFGRSPVYVMSKWWGYLTWMLPALLVVVLLYWREKARTWYGTATALFIVGLVPTLGLVMFESQGFSTVASRYAYLALVGPALAIGYTVCMPKQTWLAAACVAGVAVCGWLTWSSIPVWKSDQSLWAHALLVNPGSPVANKVLGDAARRNGDWERAKLHYEKVLAVNPTGEDIHYFVAEAERRAGNFDKAASLYERTVAIDPKFGAAHSGLGMIRLHRGDFEGALAELTKARDLLPEDAEVARSLGFVLVRQKNFTDAVQHLRASLDLTAAKEKAGLARSHALLGLAYIGTGESEKAQLELETALGLDGEQEEAHQALADIYFAKTELQKALPHYRHVVNHFDKGLAEAPAQSPPKDQEISVRHKYAQSLIAQKEYTKAFDQLTRVLELSPDLPSAVNHLGVVNFQLRRFEAATQSFERALALDPGLADPHYYIGDIARWQGKEDDAVAAYNRAVKADPRHVDAHNRLGNYHLKKKNLRAAVRHFEAALKVVPDDDRLKYNLKRAEAAQKGETEAL